MTLTSTGVWSCISLVAFMAEAGTPHVFLFSVPGQGAASAQPLILYVASENILGSLEEHRERHARDVALLRGGHLVAEGKLQQCLETHLRKLLPHPHVDLRLCRERKKQQHLFRSDLQRVDGRLCRLAQRMKSLTGAIVGDEPQGTLLQLNGYSTTPTFGHPAVRNTSKQHS